MVMLYIMYICLFKSGCATVKREESSLKIDDVKETSEIAYAQLVKLYDNIKNGTLTGKELENCRTLATELQMLYEDAKVERTQLTQFSEIDSAIQVCYKQ